MNPPNDESFLYVINDRETGANRHILSLLSQDLVFDAGLPSGCILGEMADGAENFDHKHFIQNDAFLNVLHGVIEKHGPKVPELRAEAKRQKNGWVYIIDPRTPTPMGEIPPEDIFGAFEVKRRRLRQFHGSPSYKIMAENGFMQLDPWIKIPLLEHLESLAKQSH